MPTKLTLRRWSPEAMGPVDGKAYNLISDTEAIGLGLRTTKAGAKAWVFLSPTARSPASAAGLTIGNAADWPLEAGA